MKKLIALTLIQFRAASEWDRGLPQVLVMSLVSTMFWAVVVYRFDKNLYKSDGSRGYSSRNGGSKFIDGGNHQHNTSFSPSADDMAASRVSNVRNVTAGILPKPIEAIPFVSTEDLDGKERSYPIKCAHVSKKFGEL